jgi:hypothetical protein
MQNMLSTHVADENKNSLQKQIAKIMEILTWKVLLFSISAAILDMRRQVEYVKKNSYMK